MRILGILASTAVLTSSLSAQVPNYVPTIGLVGWWPFNGNANDESGNGNNGTVNGAVLTMDRFGNAVNAYGFNGANQFISVNDLDLIDTYSITSWVNTDNDLGSIVSKYDATSNSSYELMFNNMPVPGYSNGGLYAHVGVVTVPNNNVYPPAQVGVVPLNIWTFCAFTVNDSIGKLYINGSLIYTDSTVNETTLNDVSTLFGRSVWGGNALSGALDDIGIWNRALTPAEIQALFNAALSPPCVSLDPVSFTGLGSSYTLADAPVALVGTPVGGVFIGPGISGNSFDPAVAGVGTHSIQYVYVDGNNCVNAAGQCTEVLLNVGVGGSQMGTDGVRVFPNPNRGQFTIELDLTGLVGLQVYDARGALVHNEVFQASGSKTTRNLDLSTLAKGSYTLQVRNGGGVVTQQVVIE